MGRAEVTTGLRWPLEGEDSVTSSEGGRARGWVRRRVQGGTHLGPWAPPGTLNFYVTPYFIPSQPGNPSPHHQWVMWIAVTLNMMWWESPSPLWSSSGNPHYWLLMGKSADKPKLRDILQTSWPVLLKTLKVTKTKHKSEKLPSREEAEEARQPSVMWDPRRRPEQTKDARDRGGWHEEWPAVSASFPAWPMHQADCHKTLTQGGGGSPGTHSMGALSLVNRKLL